MWIIYFCCSFGSPKQLDICQTVFTIWDYYLLKVLSQGQAYDLQCNKTNDKLKLIHNQINNYNNNNKRCTDSSFHNNLKQN